MTPLAPHITAYLRQRLPVEQAASPHTCDTYAYAFQLLFNFASCQLGIRPSELQLEHLDAPLVLAFLAHLQTDRGNRPRTRNARLTAIKSFLHFVEHRVPGALEQIRRVLSIPLQKTDARLVDHLTTQQAQALLDAPEPRTRWGRRDRAMLHLALTGGLRVSELVGLRLDELTFEAQYVQVHVRGKGRRDRLLLLWKSVGASLRAWLAVRGPAPVPELFLNARGSHMTRAGFEYVLRRHARAAARHDPGLQGKRISPHVLRHTCALQVLQATGDIRKVALWLGHQSLQTTEEYLRVDVTERVSVLESVVPPQLRPGKFRPPDQLIASLRT